MTRYIQSDKLSMHIFRDGNFNSGVNKIKRKLTFKTAQTTYKCYACALENSAAYAHTVDPKTPQKELG